MKKERLIRHGSLALDTETGQVYRAVPLVQTYSPLERYQMSKIEEKLQAQKREQARKQAREERLRRQRHVRSVRRKQRAARILGIFAIILMAVIVTVGVMLAAYCKWSDENVVRSVAAVQQRRDYPRSYDLEGSLARAGATDYKVSFDDEGYGTTVYWRLGSYQYALLPTYDTLMVYRDAYIQGALGWLAPLLPAEKIGEWHPTTELRASGSVDNGDWYVGNDVTISNAMLSKIWRQVEYYC